MFLKKKHILLMLPFNLFIIFNTIRLPLLYSIRMAVGLDSFNFLYPFLDHFFVLYRVANYRGEIFVIVVLLS
jgi:hypothetical protein